MRLPGEEDQVRQRALGLTVAIIGCFALVSASGAATTKAQKVTKINVSTRAAVVHYLRSIHVDAKHAVIQRGFRNYAGAHCPGKHWACARTKHTVVQITGHGGKNRFSCTRSHCTVVQISGVSRGVYAFGRQLAATGSGGNTASCVKTGSGATTGTGQSCTISQSGTGKNTAAVYQNSMKVSGLTAAAGYQVSITQQVTGATNSNGNTACVLQSINLDGSTTGLKGKAVSVQLDGHQSMKINQDVAGSGANRADQAAVLNGATASCDTSSNGAILQSQTITSTVNGTAGITQNLDNSSSSLCGTTTSLSPSANLCLDIEQNKLSGAGHASGTNSAVFDQENQLVALANTSASGSINQIQGNSNATIGGLAAKINQYSSAKSTFTATQNETQCEDAFVNHTLPTPTVVANCGTGQDPPPELNGRLTQQQYGPEGIGRPKKPHGRILYFKVTKDPSDSSQTGNSSDDFTITQNSKQTNDTNSVQKNNVTGGASTPGTGTVNQNVTLQGDPKVDVQVGTGNVSAFITCGGSTKALCSKTLSAPKIVTKPSNPTAYGASDASFTFSNPDPTVQFVCKLDTAANYTLCTGDGSGSFSSPSLASGLHTLSVKTKDADNTDISANDASYSWVITPPDPSITASSKPADPSAYNTSGSFQFTDADPTAIFQCKLDGALTYTACTSGNVNTNLASGSHSFSVKAYDSTGTYVSNIDASYSWVITPPNPTISSGPGTGSGSQVTSTSANFTFTDGDGTAKFECKLDNALTYTSCSASPTFTVSHGPHVLDVKATDSSGAYESTGNAEYTWEVIPYLTFEADGTGASAGWTGGVPGSSIDLTVGSDVGSVDGTYAQFTIHNSSALTASALAEPTFTTDTFSGGSPRYEIDFGNGDYAFGYPSQQGWGSDSWALNCGHIGCVPMQQVSWSAIQSAEGSELVTDALVEADGGQSAGTTDVISDFTFNGHSLSFFTN
jgi:hypothetical protein